MYYLFHPYLQIYGYLFKHINTFSYISTKVVKIHSVIKTIDRFRKDILKADIF